MLTSPDHRDVLKIASEPSHGPALQLPCEECGGLGFDDLHWRCEECVGKGSIPTDFGRAVLQFLQDHGGEEGL